MGQSDDVEDSTYSRHQELCQKLNMDASAASTAWRSYSNIRQNYTLEGEQLHWIGCALFVACRNSTTPTVGRPGSSLDGNCVSLTRLLRLCNLSLANFFKTSKLWADMANMPQEFRLKIRKLEDNFIVSTLIFKKYQPIFSDIFKSAPDENAKPQRSRRHKAMPCTPSRLFEFCWSLFICVKSAYPAISDDLVNSYHLLLVCCDFVYANALVGNRKDLLNPNFPGLPENFNDENFVPPKVADSIIEVLCKRHQAISVEAEALKIYPLRNHIIKLFNERVLRGDQAHLSGILEALNFDGNQKAINKIYEQHVLSVGDIDERIFLASDANENIGSPSKMMSVSDLNEQCQLKRDQFGSGHLAPPTPLSGRKYLKTKDGAPELQTATNSVGGLHALIAGRQPGPSEILRAMYAGCSQSVKTFIETKVTEIGGLFCSTYTHNNDDGETVNVDIGKQRLVLGQTLFYKLLEIILTDEKRMKPNYDVTNLLMNEVFLQCMFACCLEIVIWSYKNTDRMFPWILNALHIEPYYFYKVIEVIVRAEQALPREVVKHLNHIEETILENLAWKSNSPLWQAIQHTPGGVPSCEEVSLPGTFDAVDPNAPGQPALRRLALDRGNIHDVQQSPISSADRFQSPVVASGAAKKRLFGDSRSGGQSILKDKCSAKILTIDGTSRIVVAVPESATAGPSRTTNALAASPAASSTPAAAPPPSSTRESGKPRRTGSAALFFRKFYMLGAIRMQNLCDALLIVDTEMRNKIWTIFEFSIKERTNLMKDRHLDQILMSAAYVVCKLAKNDRNSFTEIMRCYRFQPQAQSHIYRSVLLARIEPANATTEEPMEIDKRNERNDDAVAPPTPSNMAGTSGTFGNEIRGDLIKFYNEVYVPAVQAFACNFGPSKGPTLSLTLSPLPRHKPRINSPVRHVTDSVRTRTLDPKDFIASTAPHHLTYCFSRSPAKDLEAINKMMISVDARKSVGKRLLSDETDVEPATELRSPTKKVLTTPFLTRKLENLIGERRTHNS